MRFCDFFQKILLKYGKKNKIKHEFDEVNLKIETLLEAVVHLNEKMEILTEKLADKDGEDENIEKIQTGMLDLRESISLSIKRIGNVESNINTRFGQLYDHISQKSINSQEISQKVVQDVKYRDDRLLNHINSTVTQTISKTLPRRSIEHLDYHLTTHCNLNCIGCSTFAPIADKTFADLEKFESDIKRLHDIIGDAVQQIHLLGGEPLLHPEAEKFAEVCRAIFKKARIDITTNGLLIYDMSEAFWKVLKDNKIAIKYTQYPISFDYNKMVEYVKQKGVYVFSAGGEQGIQYFRRIPLNTKGTFNINNSYIQCPYTDCTQLRAGRLYRCPASAYSDLLNRKLEKTMGEFNLTDHDYIELSDVKTAEEIFEFLSNAIPFCQYCDMNHIDEHVKWKTSKKDICEWVDC